MKKIRKICLAIVFVCIAASVSAQFNFGVTAGVNTSTMSGLKQNENVSVNSKTGFQIGVAAQYMFTPKVGIETGLYYTTLGVKGKEKAFYWEEGIKVEAKQETTLDPAYLHLPVSFLYKFQIKEGLYLYPSVGVYLGHGIGGKVKLNLSGNVMGIPFSMDGNRNFFGKDILIIDDEEGTDEEKTEIFNRFDMGGIAGLHLQYSNFVIGVGYDMGLLKVNKDDLYDVDGKKLSDWKNANIHVSLGYFF
ncbi:hypothetical protein FACS1894182_12830 [Bacteroidia bacterium]|nr:hypothetical protein FACS1894182_12830 [Bacteroidia bacterium]